jgi:hypothetical protein
LKGGEKMSLITWANPKIKKLNFWDIQFIKLSVAGFILMIAKLWEPLISLDWYWYAVVFILAAIKPLRNFLKK